MKSVFLIRLKPFFFTGMNTVFLEILKGTVLSLKNALVFDCLARMSLP